MRRRKKKRRIGTTEPSRPDLPLELLPRPFREEEVARQIAYAAQTSPREAITAPFPKGLHAAVTERLRSQGIEELYSHQALAVEEVLKGNHVVAVTGTNSGKTFCYSIPILQSAIAEPASRSLLIYPTKALAQDQQSRLVQLLPQRTDVATYDGDTAQAHRAAIRKSAQVILTNPDMLHVGILPSNNLWAKFFKSLRYIVLDELHVYRGVFGSNVANLLRRLLRLCEAQRNRPQIIACTATIGNPEDLFHRLTGLHATVVDQDGSPQARRTFVFLNPAAPEEATPPSGNQSTARLLATLIDNGFRTLAFSRARVSSELVLRETREKLRKLGHPEDIVEAYRAGYTVSERRTIEQGLFKGTLMGLSSTNALELGVDVGGLDAVILNGYPGSVAAFRQQAGRAGRGMREGLAVYIAREDPLEQFLLRDPEQLLQQASEQVAVHSENRTILRQHLLCAASEKPLTPSELERFGPTALELAEEMDMTGELQFNRGIFIYPGYEQPASKVNLRGMDGPSIRLLEEGIEIGTMEEWRALQTAHPGAVYLHRGISYLVDRLDLEGRMAHLKREEVPFYTQPIVQSTIEPQVEITKDDAYGCELLGVKVTTWVSGFRRLGLDGGKVVAVEELDLPPRSFDTLSVRFLLPSPYAMPDPDRFMFAVHGMEHALLAVAPLFAGCDRGDLGSAWYGFHPDTQGAAIYAYDGTPGGVGLAERLYDSRIKWLDAAWELLDRCSCEGGCPRCLYSARCEAANEHLDKPAAIALLKSFVA